MENTHELHGSALFGRWVWTTALAHAAGALAWALPAAWLLRGPGEEAGPAATAVMFGLTMIAALLQGAVLGAAQGLVLRHALPIRPLRWTGATAAGVALGWVAIVASSTALGAGGRPLATMVLSLSVVGGVFGACVGLSQWTLLREHVDGIGWVVVNAAGWALALLVTVAALGMTGAGGALALAVGATAALVSGAVIGLATGALLARIAR
ncbi:MAG: hypothetical protein KC619_01475 [Myxococcales bacterium]|nr:hypothetical protein [Myxococcales bacterium]